MKRYVPIAVAILVLTVFFYAWPGVWRYDYVCRLPTTLDGDFLTLAEVATYAQQWGGVVVAQRYDRLTGRVQHCILDGKQRLSWR